MKYKICEYARGTGDKYWTVSYSRLGIFWCTINEYRQCGIDYVYVTKQFKTKEDAVKYVECLKKEDSYREVKRNKCEII